MKEKTLKECIEYEIEDYIYREIANYTNEKEYREMENKVTEDMEYIIEAIYDIVKDFIFVDLTITHIYYGSKDLEFKFIVPQEALGVDYSILVQLKALGR